MSDAGKTPLSPDEVSALMAELTEVEEPAPAADDVDDDVVRAFALGQESFRPAARLTGLERIGERLARHMRTLIEPFARARVQVTVDPVETLRFERWCSELPGFTSLSMYRLRPMKGGMLVVVDPEFVAAMVDSLYGGNGMGVRARMREFTPGEERVLGKLTDGVIDGLVAAWAELVPLSHSYVGRETNAAYASLVRADEPVVVQRFTATIGQGRSTVISIVYPLAALRPFETQLGAKVHADAGPVDEDWRQRLSHALEAVQLPVRSVLARPELTVAQLMALKPGDVIPINLAPKVPLIVASKRLAYGTIGEQEGRVALMIDQIERGSAR